MKMTKGQKIARDVRAKCNKLSNKERDGLIKVAMATIEEERKVFRQRVEAGEMLPTIIAVSFLTRLGWYFRLEDYGGPIIASHGHATWTFTGSERAKFQKWLASQTLKEERQLGKKVGTRKKPTKLKQ